jgi:hypothetical protein
MVANAWKMMKMSAARSCDVVMGDGVDFGVGTKPLNGPWRRSTRSDVLLIGRLKLLYSKPEPPKIRSQPCTRYEPDGVGLCVQGIFIAIMYSSSI